MASRDEPAYFLSDFVQDCPGDPGWSGAPIAFRPQVAMAYQVTADQVAERLLADAGFRALRLGTGLNTPDGELMAAVAEMLTPPPYQADMELLVEALNLAVAMQQRKERGEAFGVGVGAAIGAVLCSATRN